MKLRVIGCLMLTLLLGMLLSACSNPVPPDKAAYVGEWQEKAMYLLITSDGSVRYKRLKGGSDTSIEGPLQAFVGDDFKVGLGPFSTTFVVSKPPYQEGDKWKMIVDGVTLTRTAQ